MLLRKPPGSRLGVAAFIAVVAASMLLAGCALHFADNGGNLPSRDKTIYVARFANLTRVQGINDQFLQYVKDAISSRGRLAVVDDESSADLVLTGEVVFVGGAATTFNGAYEPLIYQNTITIAATLTDRRTKKVLWHSDGISNSAQAPAVAQAIVPTSPQFLQQNLRGSDLLHMTDMQVAATQGAFANQRMMQEVAAELYADMAYGL
jgi:hypothetical protein